MHKLNECHLAMPTANAQTSSVEAVNTNDEAACLSHSEDG